MGCQINASLEAMRDPLRGAEEGEESGVCLNNCSILRNSPARETAEALLSEIPPGSKTA